MMKNRKDVVAYLKNKKEIIGSIVMVAILFGGGIGLGYYVWGVERQNKPDYTKYLEKTINYIDTIEENNRMLTKETKSLKADIAVLKKKVAETQNQLTTQSAALKKKTEDSEKAKADIQTVGSQHDMLAKENEQLKTKINMMTAELNALKEQTVRVPVADEAGVSAKEEPALQEKGEAVTEEPETAGEQGTKKEPADAESGGNSSGEVRGE